MSIDLVSFLPQHRTQVFSVLGEKGLEVPGLEYVMYVGPIRAGHATK